MTLLAKESMESIGPRTRALKTALLAAVAALAVLQGPVSAADNAPPRFMLILAERFRFESWDNAVNLDRNSLEGFSYTRNKTTLGLRWLAAKNLELTGKATNEFRVYVLPKDRVFTWHEVFFDNLYLRWRAPVRRPFTVTAGRQDIFLGEGFVVADGTPLDGSRSYYFNALRLDYELRPNHQLMFFAHAMDKTDRFLPVLHAANLIQPQPLVEQPERALGLYYTGKLRKAAVNVYVIRKCITAPDPGTVRSRIDTWGGRAVVALRPSFALTAEGALQTGTYGASGRSAFGGIAHLDVSPKWRVPYLKTLTLGGILLRGDNPATAKMEGWDPLFSRWPKWSEGYIYTFTRESRIAYWSNLNSVYGSLGFDFGSRANAALTLHRLGAEHVPPGDFPGGSGLRRGILFVGRLNFTISRILSGHFQWDRFEPGDFYAAGASGFNWLRVELLFNY